MVKTRFWDFSDMTISAVSKFCLQQNSDPFVVLKF